MNIKKWMFPLALLATSAFAAQYEAETATLGGNAQLNGTYVSQNEGSMTWKVNVTTAGKYTLTIHYKASSDKINNVEVNGSKVAEVSFPTSSGFTDVSTTVTLKAGANTVAITHSWGWIDVDYIVLEEATNEPFTLCDAPITPEATPAAKKIYNFLLNNFQQKTISGFMTGSMDGAGTDVTKHEDVQAVYTKSGKYPALVGFDFLNTTGKNATQGWFKEYHNKVMTLAEDLWNKGGIPAFTWHWNDPSDEVHEFYANQSAANGGEFTTFDFTKGFIPGTQTWDTLSTTYKEIVSDIDEISDVFLGLQEKGIAAIFRPVHESGGNWFWWSTHSGKDFVSLYRLIHDRMVHKNGVKNLVWVFNPQDAAKTSWNPGETYYDVLGIDIYNSANDHSSNSGAFDDLKAKFGKTKVLALSENGPIPDVNKMHEDMAVWSWWMPWYESWGSGFASQTSETVWKSNMEDDRIITLDEMPGWDADIPLTASGTIQCKVSSASDNLGAGDPNATPIVDYAMGVEYAKLGADGALVNTTKLPDLTSSKSISVDFNVLGSGTADGGVWIGLAFVKDGSTDEAWTWEMSPSTGCWISEGAKSTCEFDITSYDDDNGVSHPMDLDQLFSMVLLVSAEGYSGLITVNNIVTDDGKVIALFDDKKDLFNVSEGSETLVKSISLVSPDGTDKIVAPKAASSYAKVNVRGNALQLVNVKSGNMAVELFDLKGQKVKMLHNGQLSAGSHEFSLAGISKGRFIVRVKGSTLSATKTIVIK